MFADRVQVWPAEQDGLFCAPSSKLHRTAAPVPVQALRCEQKVTKRMYATLQHTSPLLQSLGPSQSSSNSLPLRAQVVPVGACGWHSPLLCVVS